MIFVLFGAWLSVLGDILIKEWADRKLWLGWGVLAYALDAFVWAKVLRDGADLSRTLVVWEVLVVLSGVLWGLLVKGESVTPLSAAGMVVALLGVVLIELGSHA